MTKRNSQAKTVVVPVAQAHAAEGQVVAAKTVVAPAEAEVVAAKAEVKADEAPVTVVAEPVAALAVPAPMAMVAEPAQATDPATTSTSAETDTGESDATPYIAGGILLGAGVLAIALSSGNDDKPTVTPTPTPTPPATPVTTVTVSSAATATVAENVATNATTGPVVLDVNATAAATNSGTPGAVTYTLGGADAGQFTINATTGEIRLNNSANFEAKPSYAIAVTASSAANGTTPAASATQNITVTVTNVNEAPSFASATATATVVENTAPGVVFTPTAATDPDANSTLTYSLGGTDAAAFTINSTTGAVSLRAAADFETKPSYTFTVIATDNGTPGLPSAPQTVTLTVTDVAEGPPALTVVLDTATAAVSGLGTGGAAQSTTFTDNTTVPSTAVINDFGRDDIVRFTGTTSVSFSSLDNDLTIEFNNAGVLNQITINDVVSPNAIITNEATAEAAVNAFLGTTGTDYFRFA